MVYEDEYNDPLGFTNEVGLLLRGVGCANLEKFKNKNIGFEDLKDLTEQDLINLDVDEKFNHDSFTKFCRNLKKKRIVLVQNADDFLIIINENKKQLEVLHIYLQYARNQIKNITDIYVESDKNLKYSEALKEACNCILEELKLLQKDIYNLQLDKKKYSNKKIKQIKYWIGGIGILTIICVCTKNYYDVL